MGWARMQQACSGYLTINDLSAYLGIKPKTLYARVKEISHYKVGRLIRFRKEDVDAWMEKHRVAKGEKEQDQKQEQTQDPPTTATEPAPKPPNARKSRKRKGPMLDIDRIIAKAIDEVDTEDYTALHGKSDQVKGSGREV